MESKLWFENWESQKRVLHPIAQVHLNSGRNDFFQFMIVNTDFSSAYGYNEKLIFLDDITIPIPYDFEMNGPENPSYATVSVIQNRGLAISEVTERYYRGYKRDQSTYEKKRQEFLQNEDRFLKALNDLEPYFRYEKEYSETEEFLKEFFKVISNDNSYNSTILARARDQ